MKKTLYIIAVCIVGVALITLAVFACMGKRVALYLLIGLAFNYVLSTVLHETGHIVVGKARKMKFAQGGIFFLKFYRKGKKLKTKFALSSVAGEVELISDKPEKAFGDLLAVSVCSLVVTLCYIVLGIIIGFAVGTPFSRCFLVYGNIITLYMFLINALPFIPTNDGSVFFGLLKGNKKYLSYISLQRIVSYLYNGVSPKDIPETEFTEEGLYSEYVKYYRFLAYLDGGLYEKAYLLSSDFSDDYTELGDRVLAERLFLAINLGIKDEIEKIKEQALNVCAVQEAFALRVSGAYRLYNGETDWGKLCVESAQKLAKQEFLAGLRIMEINLLSKIG